MPVKKKKAPKGSTKKESKLKKKPPSVDQIESGLDFKLPTKKNKPSESIEDYAFHIYGPKGIGKTSLAAMFEDSLTFQFEPGGKALTTYQLPCPTWMHFRRAVDMLEEDHSQYRNVVIDTCQLAYDGCLSYACKKAGISHPADEAYGKGWKRVSTEFANVMNRAGLLDLGFFAISHDVDKEIETRSGRKFMKCQPNLSGQAESYFSGPIDIVGYYHYDNEERWLQIRGNDYIEAKCRLQNNFIARDGTPVYKIPMGNSPEESYENLVAAFNNEQKESYAPEERKTKLKSTKKSVKKKSVTKTGKKKTLKRKGNK